MNPEQPSREEIEARITALLLGELPAEEAALLCHAIAQDAALKKLHAELQSTIVLVREAKKNPADAPAETNAPLKLSDERRQKLFAHFKTPRPKESFWIRRLEIPSLTALAVTALVIVIVVGLAALSLPNYVKARATSPSNAVVNNLRQIDAAKNQWALENKKPAAAVPTPDDLTPYLVHGKIPPPVMGETYVLGSVSEPVSAEVDARIAKKQLGALADQLPSGGKPGSQRVYLSGNGELSLGSKTAGQTQFAELSPTTITVAPAPVIAPPPAAIVLPKTETTTVAGLNNSTPVSQPSAVGGSPMAGDNLPSENPSASAIAPGALADTAGEGVESQHIVGYVNIQLSTNAVIASAAPVAGTVNAGTVITYSGAATRGGFGGGGFGGGGGAGGTTFSSRTISTYDDSAGSTSRAEASAANPMGAFPGQAEKATNDNFGLYAYQESAALPPPELPPAGKLGWASDSAKDKKLNPDYSDQLFSNGLQNHAGAQVDSLATADGNGTVENRLYRKPAQKSEAINAPFLKDVPVTGSLFKSPANANMPPPTAAPVAPGSSTLALNEDNRFISRNGFVAGDNLDLGAIHDDTSLSPKPTLDKEEFQHINEQILDDERNLEAQSAQIESLRSIQQTNPARLRDVLPTIYPDAELTGMMGQLHEAQRQLATATTDYAANSQAVAKKTTIINTLDTQINDRVAGIMTGLETGQLTTKASLDALKDQVAEAKKTDYENAIKYQPYYVEKRKLQDMEETHKLLNLKITANAIDAKIPTTSMVQLTAPAQPNQKQTFWQSLWGEYASTATMKVENEGSTISGLGQQSATAYPYDPYFIQTTFEVIKSQRVLGKVVDSLKLDEAWSKKDGGEKLGKNEAMEMLRSRLSLSPVKNTKLVAITVTGDKPEETAQIANAVALAYQAYRIENNQAVAAKGLGVLQQQYAEEDRQIQDEQAKLAGLEQKPAQKNVEQEDLPVRRPPANAPVPQPEILTSENNFSTFSLNVSDVSYKLAAASLEQGQMPDAAGIRSEEFINAFDYRDPAAAPGQPMAFASEIARYPFAQNRDLLRFSVKTAAAGRPAGGALNLVLLLDVSGSMERADRVAIIREALRVLAGQLQPQDTVSVVTFARTARLWADGIPGDKAGATLDKAGGITPEGGTNLEEAMRLAYETARRHYLANGMNRVVLLTDGAANLGNVDPAVLKQKVEAQRRQGIALDCFGIGFDGYDDDLMEQLSRNGDGRYAFINSPDEAGTEFAAKLAGALQVAASDVKVQVEFNPDRVIAYRQIGYAKHQLTKEQFRDNSVLAAEIAAQEAGNALYTIEVKPDGTGPIATVHVRYRVPGTTDYQEHSWEVAYAGKAPALAQSGPAMRLAATASAFSEWLAASPYAQEVTPDELLKYLSGVPEVYGADGRPKQLEWMIRQAKSLSGK